MSLHHSSSVFGNALRWASFAAQGKGSEFYRHDPEGYEAVARILLGRQEVADSVRRIVDHESSPRPKLLVDSACGSGLITNALAGSAERVVGIDSCKEILAFAEQSKNPSIEFQYGDLNDFSKFDSKSIEVYSLAFAHRYIRDLQHFYHELARVLAHDGVAIISSVGHKSTLEKIEQSSQSAKLNIEVVKPQFRSLFNRLHGTAHVLLRH